MLSSVLLGRACRCVASLWPTCATHRAATDPRAIAADRILSAILESLQVRSRDLPIAMAALRIVRRSHAVGRSPISAHGYMVYATLLAAGLGSIDAAIEYGQLALGMAAADNSLGSRPVSG